MSNLTSALHQLQRERDLLQAQIERLGKAISALQGVHSARPAGRGSKVVSIARRRPKLSAAGIAHIRAAQKQRWAKWRKAHKG
jgi:hypothetical protein